MTAPVFISHSSIDKAFALRICIALEKRGLACWMAGRDVRVGENYQRAIVLAIRAAKVMVVVFTENANNSPEVEKELALASQHKLRVMPARMENAIPSEAFAYEMATRQWIDLFDNWDEGTERLATSIAEILSPVSTPPSRPAAVPESRPRPLQSPAAPVVPSAPKHQPPPRSVSPPSGTNAARGPTADAGTLRAALPRSVRTVAVLLVAQSVVRFGFLLYALISISTYSVSSLGALLNISVGIVSVIAGVLILRRSKQARPIGVVTGAFGLAVQAYFYFFALSSYFTYRSTNTLFQFVLWVLNPVYLLIFAASIAVLYRWRVDRI